MLRAYDYDTGLFRAEPPVKLRPDAVTPPPETGPTPPATAARFGPNGTYWSADTPLYDGSDSALDIEVACTASAIKAAIQGLTAQQVADGVRILVQPGTLGASGASETSPTIAECGDPTWTRRVLVRPRDTRDSVTWAFRFVAKDVHSVIWAGFVSDGHRFYGGQRAGWARIKMLNGATWKVYARSALDGFYIGETVRDTVQVSNGDSSNIDTTGGDMTGLVCEGWHISPNYKADSSGHTDTFQAEPYNGFYIRDAIFRGVALWGGSNTALQCNGILGATLEECYMVENISQTRYPYPGGYDPALQVNGHAINGKVSARDHALHFVGGAVLGNLAGAANDTYPIRSVSGTETNNPAVPTTTGTWTVDAALTDDNHPDSPPAPTDAYLNSIWGL